MSNININCTELLALLEIIPPAQNIMLVGNHGIGKSEILTEYYSSKGMKVVTLFLGQMSDPGDIIGLPNKDKACLRTEFLPPYWFPIDEQPIVLFLDELNRARPEVLQTIMDLTLNRKLAGKHLPEGSRIISAVNDGDIYQLTDLDPALVSRFNIMAFQPTVQEWLSWAKNTNCDERVISFIEENPAWLDRDPDVRNDGDLGLDKQPDRRAWKRVSDMISGVQDLKRIHAKAIASIVGKKAATNFINTFSTRTLLNGRDILLNLSKCLSVLRKYRLHELSTVNENVFRTLEVSTLTENEKCVACENIDKYFSFLANEKKEAAAHFANLYTGKIYPKAVEFMARECTVLTISLVTYVKGIK